MEANIIFNWELIPSKGEIFTPRAGSFIIFLKNHCFVKLKTL